VHGSSHLNIEMTVEATKTLFFEEDLISSALCSVVVCSYLQKNTFSLVAEL